MRTPTWGEIKTQIEDEADLHEESFIDSDEILAYANDAIDECEAEIHLLYADYFLTKYAIPLVSGTADYDLPTAIYANKIRFVQYDDGAADVYEVARIKPEEMDQIALIETGDDYRYHLIHDNATDGVQMRIYPTPDETNSTNMWMFFIRNANRLTADTSLIDIPEFVIFIKNYVKVQIATKEQSPMLQKWMRDLEVSRVKMRTTLGEMVPDADSYIIPDMTFYYEME